jgi:parallel beta-helix repeat protein
MPAIGERRVRTATFVVAASDSMVQDKAMADYICTGTNDHLVIQAALDALPATGGEVRLLDGTYNIEVSLVMDSYQTLRGCGYNTVLTTSTALSGLITAAGGAGTEKEGIVVSDLRIDAASTAYAGIYWNYVDYSEIKNVWVHDCDSDIGTPVIWGGLQLLNCDNDTLTDNICVDNLGFGIQLGDTVNSTGACTYIHIENNHCQGNKICGIILTLSNNNTVTGNTCQGNEEGIYLDTSNNNTVTGNTCQGNEEGISLATSDNNTVTGNTCQGNGTGIYLATSDNNTVTGNTCQGNGTGIYLYASDNNTLTDNTLTENSQSITNNYDDIKLEDSSYNNIQGNTCRAGDLANVPRYGINISNVGCVGNLVVDNDLYDDGFGTAPFNDAGTGTKLNTYCAPFVDGSDPQDSGYLVDANTEYARSYLRLPDKVHQVVRMKVYARSVILEADKMRAEFVVYGGADNEAYNTHNGSVANHRSTSSNFAADDVIYWTLTTAGVLALLGGDSIEIKVLHEAAGNGDCATNGYFRTVEIEYV